IFEPDCQQLNGYIEVSATGGTPGYDYVWLDVNMDSLVPAQTGNIAMGLFAGIDNVAITDNNGCGDTFNVILNNNNAPDIALDCIVNVSCNGLCDGAVYVTLTGGTQPYITLWSSGDTLEDDTNVCAGFDTLAVADSNFCLSFDIFEVTEPP